MFSHRLFILALGALAGAPVPAVQAQQSPDSDSSQPRIDEIVVLGTDPARYRTDATRALSGLELDFMELPRMVEVIPEQLLLDQKVTELEEALRNVPGISLGDGFGGSNNDYFVRGFRRNTVYRNGLRVRSNFRTNTGNLAQVQVVKGPASITHGQVEPGGLVDIITKKPLEEQRLYLEGRAGSYDSRYFLADWSRPLGDRGAVRINATTEGADTFRDFFEVDRDAVSVTGRFDLTDATSITAEYEYRDEFRSFDRGTVTVPTPEGREIAHRLLDIDISTRFGEPFEEIDTEFEFSSIGIDHTINDQWAARFVIARESSSANDYQARPVAILVLDEDAAISEDGFFSGAADPKPYFDDDSDQVFLARRSDGSREREVEVDYLQGELTGEWHWGRIRHRMAFGADYSSSKETRYFVATPVTDGIHESEGGAGPLLNLRQPVYGSLTKDVSTEGALWFDPESEEYGVFVNDYMDITDRLGVLLGARFDVADTDGSGPAEAVSQWSPQVAVNYLITDGVTVFTSFSEAFEPNTVFILNEAGESSESQLFDPENSRQYEVGSKALFLDEQLKVSAALYDIEKSNVLTTVDGLPQLVDGQRARGFELSVSGQPTDGLNLVVGYAYTDAEILAGGDSGNRPANVAEHTANLWASYEFQRGALEGVGAGAGAYYMGDRYGDSGNTWRLGDYTLMDASLWYNVNASALRPDSTVRFQLAFKNFLGEEYYPASGGDLRISLGAPRTVVGSVSVTF